MYDSRRLVMRTWSRFFRRTSGSIAARSDGWYISFMAASYPRGRRTEGRPAAGNSAAEAGPVWPFDHERGRDPQRREHRDRSREPSGESRRPERQLEHGEHEGRDIAGAEDRRPPAGLPVEEADDNDPDDRQDDQPGDGGVADDLPVRDLGA